MIKVKINIKIEYILNYLSANIINIIAMNKNV